jgi:hypothetical protein
MKIKTKSKIIYLTACLASVCAFSAYSDPVIINNNMAPPQQNYNQPPNNPPPHNGGGTGSPHLDPRVPPAGVYKAQNGDGSSQTLYTTGETKPYDPSGGSTTNSSPEIISPQVYTYGGDNNNNGPRPGPRR